MLDVSLALPQSLHLHPLKQLTLLRKHGHLDFLALVFLHEKGVLRQEHSVFWLCPWLGPIFGLAQYLHLHAREQGTFALKQGHLEIFVPILLQEGVTSPPVRFLPQLHPFSDSLPRNRFDTFTTGVSKKLRIYRKQIDKWVAKKHATPMQDGSGGDEVHEGDKRCHQERQDDERRDAKGRMLVWCRWETKCKKAD